MSDITQTNLDAAFIDQIAAGAFAGREYAFTAALGDTDGFILGVAVKDEPGYSPIAGKKFDTYEAAQNFAAALNAHIGLSCDAAVQIVVSSMRRGS